MTEIMILFLIIYLPVIKVDFGMTPAMELIVFTYAISQNDFQGKGLIHVLA